MPVAGALRASITVAGFQSGEMRATMENEGLDEILNGSGEDEDPIVEPKSELHEPSPIVDRPRDEHGRFAKQDTGETQAEPEASASPAPEPTHIPESALLGERRRRQEAEQRAQYLEQQMQAFQRQQQPQQPVDFWEDPNAVISTQVNQAVNTALQQWEARQVQMQAEKAEAAARAKYQDYDDAFAKFREQLQINPALLNELQRASDPAEFAYQRGKAAIDMADPDAYRAKVESELEAKLRAKIEAELLASAPRPHSLPTTTAGQRSVGDRGGPAWAGPTPLPDILR